MAASAAMPKSVPMQRKKFLQLSAATAASFGFSGFNFQQRSFPVVRTAPSLRKFRSEAVENVIRDVSRKTSNKEIAWLFENCFPNTLDTTVDFQVVNGRPDTYVITGDIDAMWLRDSSAQVWPYLPLCDEDENLQQLIKGVINRQVQCILKDPYANAFYKDETRISEWKETDITDMKPGVHERKWEIDSLCYPVRLAHGYYTATGDKSAFDNHWAEAMKLVIQTFREQQRFNGHGPYSFQRKTAWATDGVAMGGYGYPAKPNGLICSMFRPSDDATLFSYLIPSNFFAVQSLSQMAALAKASGRGELAADATKLMNEVKNALDESAVVDTKYWGKIYAFEVNGFGSVNLMDDANIPSLLSLPYLGAVAANDVVYQNTRKYILSEGNPFYFKGKAGEGIGGPHIGLHMIWPMSIIMRGLTSHDDAEIKLCLDMLCRTHGDTGFMHESFHQDDPSRYTRKWFAWANTLFGEFVWHIYREKPGLLA